MSWKPEIKVASDEKWYSNQLVFASKEEAEEYARNLYYRWTATVAWRAVQSEDTVNYTYLFGQLVPIDPENQTTGDQSPIPVETGDSKPELPEQGELKYE